MTENKSAPKAQGKDTDPFEEHDKRYEPKRRHYRKPLSGSQYDLTGEGSVVFPPGVTGRLVDDDGNELTIYERLALLEGDNPPYGHHA